MISIAVVDDEKVFSDQMTGNKRGFGFILATFVLALHFISGLYYVFYIGVLGNWI